MSLIIDGSNGLTFPNSTTQASAGQVLQVVNATYSTQSTTTSATFVDTSITATITPKFSSSKILVLSTICGIYVGASTTIGYFSVARNGSTVTIFDTISGYNTAGSGGSNSNCSYVDSPSTTSAITYKIQVLRYVGSGTVNWCNNNGTSTITLLEIAA